jgi:sortase A
VDAARAREPTPAGPSPAAGASPAAGSSPPRSPLRAVVRFVGSVLAVSGVLLLADAAVTVAWQEPVTAFLGNAEQNRLEDELAGLEERTAPRPGAPFRPARGARALLRSAGPGDALGRIVLPALDRDYVIVEGTGTAELRQGPGHYEETGLPGMGRTVGVAGHRTTWLAPFRTLDRLDRGDSVVLEMPYGRFTYRVERRRIVDPGDVGVIRDVRGERLVLTACHPLYSAERRIVVFARLADAAPVRRERR